MAEENISQEFRSKKKKINKTRNCFIEEIK